MKRKTFIFFDEIQEFKELTTKVKFWVEEGSFRYVFSGSLLGVALKNLKSAPVGYLKTLTMYPLDFEEFLQIYNFTDALKELLHKSFVNRTSVNETVHNRMMQIFNMYLNVGSMPSAVEHFKETRSLEDVISEHEDIVLQYKKDFTRYERSEDNFIWLASAGVALPVYNVSAPALPLLLNKKSSLFKLFLSDIGMLTTLYGRATKMQLHRN